MQKISFVALENVYDPETQSDLLVIEGFRYTLEQLQLLSTTYGIDNIQGTIWIE